MLPGVKTRQFFQVLERLCYGYATAAASHQIRRLSVPVVEGQLEGIIKSITVEAATILVPEIKLHLITPDCLLWRSKPEDCPIDDPFWAFFWPGGQALCRYLLDDPELCKDKNVLEIGSGSGAIAIAAATSNANLVIANDIDPIANTAIRMNLNLNKGLGSLDTIIQLYSCDILPVVMERPLENFKNLQQFTQKDYGHTHLFDVVLIGDMCYDETMASKLLMLLNAIQITNPDVCILLGDPGRYAMKDICERVDLEQEYPLAQSEEYSWGFPSSCVYRFRL